jgi:ElaB/YqjD/DUF883 family membrane-anchored ribosome-binding protein
MGNSASAVAESIGHAAAEQAQRLGEQAQQWQESATKMAQDTYSNVRDSASEYIQQGRERAMQLEESVETFIHDQPLKSILIAAGIGFACGFLLMRRLITCGGPADSRPDSARSPVPPTFTTFDVPSEAIRATHWKRRTAAPPR